MLLVVVDDTMMLEGSNEATAEVVVYIETHFETKVEPVIEQFLELTEKDKKIFDQN